MHHDPITEGEPLADYTPIVLARRRHDGWTADRQRAFLTALAETGCVSEACHQAGITARSAYRLRAHGDGAAFAAAWDQALRFAAGKLMTLAYERAVRGAIREQWRDGKLVSESREPSDKLLIFLLDKFAPWNDQPTTRWGRLTHMAGTARGALAESLDALADTNVSADALIAADYEADPPLHGHDPLRAPGDDDA